VPHQFANITIAGEKFILLLDIGFAILEKSREFIVTGFERLRCRRFFGRLLGERVDEVL
jgi:hypothetical protein